MAENLLAEGCRVAICAREGKRLNDAAAKLGAAVFAQTADVATPGQVEAFIDAAANHLGGLDILVHNAGGGGGAGLEAPDAEFTQSLEVNVLGGLRAARAAVPIMRRRRRGRLIFISSAHGPESGGRTGDKLGKGPEN